MPQNRAYRRFALFFGGVSVIAVITGFCLSTGAGVLALLLCAVLGAAFYAFTAARRRQIAKLSEQIDLVLHDEDRLSFDTFEEGELSVLESELAKMTLRIREQNEALQAEKTRLSDALADIAHQLRTPLTSANLILSLIRQEPDESRRRALLRESEELFKQMDWLVSSLLKLSRLDAGVVSMAYAPIDVAALVQAAAQPLLIPLELHGVTLTLSVPEGARLCGDAAWLKEALQNILKNCMENAGEGGGITLDCLDTPLFTELRIRDHGPGFDNADIPFLFERFYRGRNADASGYGIGLALCRVIIARQGGAITARNHPEGGAEFAIRFPK